MRSANKAKTTRAQQLRKPDNDAEDRLWAELRGRRLNGYKFVRQWRIGPYFADFACREKNLVVEVDGSQHEGSKQRDEFRDLTMNRNGWSVLRFWNIDLLRERRQVCETIIEVLEGRLIQKSLAIDLKFKPAERQQHTMMNAFTAPHPPFGHLLPVNGEKE